METKDPNIPFNLSGFFVGANTTIFICQETFQIYPSMKLNFQLSNNVNVFKYEKICILMSDIGYH